MMANHRPLDEVVLTPIDQNRYFCLWQYIAEAENREEDNRDDAYMDQLDRQRNPRFRDHWSPELEWTTQQERNERANRAPFHFEGFRPRLAKAYVEGNRMSVEDDMLCILFAPSGNFPTNVGKPDDRHWPPGGPLPFQLTELDEFLRHRNEDTLADLPRKEEYPSSDALPLSARYCVWNPTTGWQRPIRWECYVGVIDANWREFNAPSP